MLKLWNRALKGELIKMKNKKLFIKDNYYKILPLALILLIVPCIVYLNIITIKGAATELAPTGDKSYDFFSYYKSVWLIVFTLLSTVFCLIYVKLTKFKLKLPAIFIPLLVYYLFVFLSTALSKYHDQAYWGFTDRYEGFFVISCYMLICLMAAIFVTYENDIKILFGAIVICGFIVGILGISQFWGYDFFQTDFGRSLIVPTANHNLLDELVFKFPKQYIYSTLYNPNYVGSFCALLFPISIAFAVLSKRRSHKIISYIFSCVMFINLIGCLSTTGYIGSFLAVVLLVVLLRKHFFKAWRALLILLASFAILLFWMNNLSSGAILPGFKVFPAQTAQIQTSLAQSSQMQPLQATQTLKPQTLKVQSEAQHETSKAQTLQVAQPQTLKAQILQLSSSLPPQPLKVQASSIQIDNSTSQDGYKKIINFSIYKNTFKIYLDSNKVANITFNSNTKSCTFSDASGNSLNIINNPTDSTISFADPNYKGLTVKINGSVLNISAYNTSFNIYISIEENTFKIVNSRGVPTNIESPESIGFEGKEKWASSRGYIWSRSIPLLKDTLFIGNGPDTFALIFPQNDFVGKLKSFDTPYIVVDKPHNMYLQMALNTGVPSLLAFIVFVLWYLINSIRTYFKPKDINTYYIAGVSCVTAVVGFIFSGIANDSVVSVSPIFWILLGTGIACNRLYPKSILEPTTQKQQPFPTNGKSKYAH